MASVTTGAPHLPARLPGLAGGKACSRLTGVLVATVRDLKVEAPAQIVRAAAAVSV